MSDLEKRLERLESRVDRILDILEGGTLNAAAAQAEAQLSAEYGQPALRENMSELLLRLQDPEVTESLTRIAVLVPKIEYALQAVAAGPELLEEAMEMARSQLGDGHDTTYLQYRLKAAARSLGVLAEPRVVEVVAGLAAGLPDVAPFGHAAEEAGRRLMTVESSEELTERISDALVRLAETETLDSLLRIAELAPHLEYAVNFLAAGPALLEDGLADVRARMAAQGADVGEVDRRLEALMKVLPALTAPKVIAAAGDLGALLPVLRPFTAALGRATEQLQTVETPEKLTERLAETILALTEEETLASLTRIAQLTPHLEYAVEFAAAGPALLEDAMHMVQKWSDEHVGEGVRIEDRMNELAKIMVRLTGPSTLRNVNHLTEAIEPALRDRDTMEALAKIVRLLPQFREPLESMAEAFESVDAGAVIGLMEAAKDPEVQHAIKGLVELTPQLERPLRALPFQDRTLAVLRTLNAAVEHGVEVDRRAGLFALMGALRDPAIQRAAGFALHVAHELGTHLQNGRSNGHALPARS